MKKYRLPKDRGLAKSERIEDKLGAVPEPPPEEVDLSELLSELNEERRGQLKALPPEKQKEAYGLSLILNGYSVKKAAKMSEIHYDRMRRRWAAFKKALGEENIATVQQIAVSHAQEIEDEAYRQLRDALHAGKIHDSQLFAVWGTAQDKLAKHAATRTPKEAASEVTELIKLLHSGGKVTLEVETTKHIDAEVVND